MKNIWYNSTVYKMSMVFTVCVIIAAVTCSVIGLDPNETKIITTIDTGTEIILTTYIDIDNNETVRSNNSTIRDNNKTITGNYNSIYGDNNIINGNTNEIYGDNNIINGNYNVIYGENNKINGNTNSFTANAGNTIIKGNYNEEME